MDHASLAKELIRALRGRRSQVALGGYEVPKMSADKEYSCGLEAALAVVGGKWKVLILWVLGNEARRFGELRRQIPGLARKC